MTDKLSVVLAITPIFAGLVLIVLLIGRRGIPKIVIRGDSYLLLLVGASFVGLMFLMREEFLPNQYELSSNFHETRHKIIVTIKDSPLEVGYLIDPEGRIIGHGIGNEFTVDIDTKGRSWRDLYLIHNHPSEGPCQLSKQDLLVRQVRNLLGIEAVCSDGSSDIQMR